jgi:hypothetical protein
LLLAVSSSSVDMTLVAAVELVREVILVSWLSIVVIVVAVLVVYSDERLAADLDLERL